MNSDASANFWISEPSKPDDTSAYRSEHTLDWLTRSTNPRARACRSFLNTHLALLPVEAQQAFQSAARYRWNSAFFELILARILQLLGAKLEIEVANEAGKRPDFTAHFSDSSIVVEAVSPIINGLAGVDAKNRIPLLDYIESHIPEGWRIGVSSLPDIGPSTSRKEFERVVTRLLAELPTSKENTPIELIEHISTGTIHLQAFPYEGSRSKDTRRLLWEAPFVTFDNTEKRIRHAIQKKRQQVRRSELPVLLAIHAAGMMSELEDFDKALYGYTYGRYDHNRQLVETGFYADGEFTIPRSTPPTYAGVLAFTELGFAGGSVPVLYPHPRYRGQLPAALQELEQRFFDSSVQAISTKPSTSVDFMARLDFVTRTT